MLVAGCADPAQPPSSVEGSSRAESGTPCVAPSALDAASVPPPPVDLPPGSVLTDVRQAGEQRLVTGRVSATVDQVLAHLSLIHI